MVAGAIGWPETAPPLVARAIGSESHEHSLSYVGSAADDVYDTVTRVNLKKVKLLGSGVILNGKYLCNHDAVSILALDDDILNLSGGKSEIVNKCLLVKTGKINEISNPIHR